MENSKNGALAAHQVFSKMFRWQLSASVIAAALAFSLSGTNAAISALLGGLAVILGTLAAAKVAQRGYAKQDASAILMNLLKAEAVKVLVIVVALFMVFKLYHALVPLALIAGVAVSALISGAGLSKMNDGELDNNSSTG